MTGVAERSPDYLSLGCRKYLINQELITGQDIVRKGR
jgi:hypothetical protein